MYVLKQINNIFFEFRVVLKTISKNSLQLRKFGKFNTAYLVSKTFSFTTQYFKNSCLRQ